MRVYQNFIGIDIGKETFMVAIHPGRDICEYPNTHEGISTFINKFHSQLVNALVILETTGGYEMRLLLALCAEQVSTHRANTRKVKNFIRSFGNVAKTDKLDAKALALYGHERHGILEAFQPVSQKMLELHALAERRRDLTKMVVAEKNRKQAPTSELIQSSCAALLSVLKAQVEEITRQIQKIINTDSELKTKQKVLKTISGIGDKISQDLLAFMPELGTMTRRQVASLAGVAPRANDSGKFRGYRHTGHGRDNLKPMLFLAAMAARNSHSELKDFYLKLIEAGKSKMVALTALMRKIIVIANAKIRDRLREEAVTKI